MKITLNPTVLKRAKAQFIEDSSQYTSNSELKWYDSLFNPWTQPLLENERAVVVDLGGSYVRIGVVTVKQQTEYVLKYNPDSEPAQQLLTQLQSL